MWPDTLADAPGLMAERAVLEKDDYRDTDTVVAPCCGRKCAADMVVDLRGVAGTPKEWACDACRWRIIRDPETPWTKAKLIRALGASAAEVRVERAKELLRERERRADPDIPFNAHEALQEIKADLPTDKMPDGTVPPDG